MRIVVITRMIAVTQIAKTHRIIRMRIILNKQTDSRTRNHFLYLYIYICIYIYIYTEREREREREKERCIHISYVYM